MEILTATGLSSAAGLNAYIPLLIMGALDKFTSWVNLPPAWNWLSSWWSLGILAVLLVVEVVADKIPALDSVNDIVHTFIRPASGGIVFASGVGAQTVATNDPDSFFADTSNWLPIVIGLVIALVVHLTKASARPIANVTTAGLATPFISAGEDTASLGISLLAVVAPIIALILVVIVIAFMAWAIVTVRRSLQRVSRSGRHEREIISDADTLDNFNDARGRPTRD